MYYTFQNSPFVILTDNQEIDSYLARHSHQIEELILVAGVAGTLWLIVTAYRRRPAASAEIELAIIPRRAYSSHEITQVFLSSIPSITAELNLEVATSEQIETFDRTDKLSVLWGFLDLGVNSASIQVPVTYRYHIRLDEPWRLELEGTILRVHAPALRASLPPVFHSDRMMTRAVRGWFRRAPDELLKTLHREITPLLSGYAEDPRRIDLIRETCRQVTAEFVRKCFSTNPNGLPQVAQIQVQFAGEARTQSAPHLRLQQPPIIT